MLREVCLIVAEPDAERLADALLEAGALSVSVEDAEADTARESPLYGEPGLEPERLAWKRNRMRVLVDAACDPVALLREAAAACAVPEPGIESLHDVGDADWVRLTQAQFPPVRISERLWIVPSWHAPPEPPAIAIRLDPGAAFGTGTHPTTRLCLRWLDAELRPGARVLDYGCGSGILAIAAAKLGASRVIGTDLDPHALATARANSDNNAVIADYTAPDRLPAGTFDLVLANILSNPLMILAPALLARVAPGGSLVLSGILERQAQAVIDAYAAADARVPLRVWGVDEGWVCLAGTRPE
ncbi:MAG: 50S ribosomal protein L11 methyltransferase [Burkholderiaceae bacterium]